MKRHSSPSTDRPELKKIRVTLSVNRQKRELEGEEEPITKKRRLPLRTLAISHQHPAYTIRDPHSSFELIVDGKHYSPHREYFHIRTELCPYSDIVLVSDHLEDIQIEEHDDWSLLKPSVTTISGITYDMGVITNISCA